MLILVMNIDYRS